MDHNFEGKAWGSIVEKGSSPRFSPVGDTGLREFKCFPLSLNTSRGAPESTLRLQYGQQTY